MPNISTLSTRRLVAYILLIAALAGAFWYFSDLVAYIMVAWVLSLIGRPLVRFYRRFVGDAAASGLTLLTFAVVIAANAGAIVPSLIDQAENLSEVNYAKVGTSLSKPIEETAKQLRAKGWIPRSKGSTLSNIQQKLTSEFEPSQITYLIGKIVGSAWEFLVAFSIIIFILFFFLKDPLLFENAIKAIVPLQHEDKTQTIVNETSTMITRYVMGLLIQLTVFAVCVGGGLSILGVPNAILIGFLGGLFNLVPYIGPIVASGLGVLLTISSNLDLEFYTQMKPLIFKVLLTFWSVQFLDNFILHPYIFSNSVKAHPLEIFMIVLVGAHLGGAAGMILATPLYTTGKIILKAFFREYKFVQFLTGNMDEPPAPVLEINDEDDTISQSEIG
jgi:predicted PurR-regulated permease PerM